MVLFRCIVYMLLMCVSTSSVVRANGYAFTNIVDTTVQGPTGLFEAFGFSTDGSGFYNIPVAINGDRVAFLGRYDSQEGVFVGSGGPLTTIVKQGDPGPTGTFSRFSDIGISGSTATFLGRWSSPGAVVQSVFSGDGGPLASIGGLGAAAFPATGDGAVAFLGSHLGQSGIFVESHGTLTPIVLRGDPAPSGEFTSFRDLAIDDGTVSFTADFPGGHGVFSSSGAMVTTIAKVGDMTSAGALVALGGGSISNNVVAFGGRYGGGGPNQAGIFVGSGGPLVTIANAGDITENGALSGFDVPAISNGIVAFHAGWNGGHGILVWNAGELKTAIKTGDPLFGSTLVNFGFRRFGLDPESSGNLAFAYVLADGRLGVALAQPVPEPSSQALVVFVLLARIREPRRRTSLIKLAGCDAAFTDGVGGSVVGLAANWALRFR